MPATPLVTLSLFGVEPARVPLALARMGLDRRHLRRTRGLAFWKLLGTGDGRTFDVRDADPRTWGLLAAWQDPADFATFANASPVVTGWKHIAHEHWQVRLRPLSSRGRWSGRQPFGPGQGGTPSGPVAAITRARLRPRMMPTFWRAVPPVNQDLHAHPGLLLSVGIGEAPVGLQGTFSLWRSARDLAAFAYRGSAHQDVIARSQRERWYAEELFARFAVLGSTGRIWGGDPLDR